MKVSVANPMGLSSAYLELEDSKGNIFRIPALPEGTGRDVGVKRFEAFSELAAEHNKFERIAKAKKASAAKWQVKDYADGWIEFDTLEEAIAEVIAMGCAMIRPKPRPIEVGDYVEHVSFPGDVGIVVSAFMDEGQRYLVVKAMDRPELTVKAYLENVIRRVDKK